MPAASASTSSGKSPGIGTRVRKDRTESQSPCGPWRKCIFATNQARGVHVRQRARVGRDAFRRKQKNPFQEKVIVSISKGKRGLQSRKTFRGPNGALGSGPDWLYRALVVLGTGVPPFRQAC